MAAKLKVDHLDENSIRARETNTSANVMAKSPLIIMIMNTSGVSPKNSTEKRKQAIYDIVTNTGAALFLLQKFRWKDMRSKAWVEFNWPEQLQYTGHKHASLIYDVNEVTIKGYSQKTLDDTLRELQRSGSIHQAFSPFPRMCVTKINTKVVPVVNFICISWHGRKLDDLKEFKCLLKYVLKLSENEALPIIIAGDFNVKIKDIEKLVPPKLILHRYTPTGRRDEDDIIDFYISTRSLVMSDMKALKWESQTKVDDVLLLFDHDPVVTSVTSDEAKGYNLDVKSKAAKLKVAQLDENSIKARETNTSANVMPKSPLIIMIMNTGGVSPKNSTEKRKQAIYDIVTNTGAALFLLQEFRWKDMRSKAWVEFNWPERLQYTGNKDASIIYDVNEVTIKGYSQTLLDDTLRELKRIGSIHQAFSPISRMCVRKIKTKGVPVVNFICISWHGLHNKMNSDDLKEEFDCLLKYVLKLSEKKTLPEKEEKLPLPVIIGGDFNVKIEDIEHLVKDSLILHRYTPRARREKNIIDFYISSRSLVMSDIKALEWESETSVDHVLSLFDHDPVVTSVITDEAKGYNLDVKSSKAPQRRRLHTNRNTSRLVTPPVHRCVLSSPVESLYTKTSHDKC